MADESEFEWDEAKRAATLAKHGIDFIDVVPMFRHGLVTWRLPHKSEDRWIAVGMIAGREVAAIYTMRGERTRIITVRRARHDERRAYHADEYVRHPEDEG